MSITEIQKMTTSEKLSAMEELWDSLLTQEATVESPSWHGEVLANRKKMMDSAEATYYTVEELRNRLKS